MWSRVSLSLVAARVVSSTLQACDTGAFSIPGSDILLAEKYAKGDVISLPETVASCGGPNTVANVTSDICRLVINVPTSDSSAIRLEAWLPNEWNEKFLATGNGGIGGCIDYSTMQNGAQLGFAAFGTNAGHDGSAGFDFFLNQPEVINDFGYRAIHVEAEVGKQYIEHYYGTSASRSYYQGCSTGGRQGLQNAKLFPADFDGVLAGAPGIDWLHIVASKGILARRIGWPDLDSRAYVRPEQWRAIVAKQVELLDPLDGVVDGVIDDPTMFRFDPEILACGTGALDDALCLGPDQVLSVKAAYQPLTNAQGEIVYPPFELGSNTAVFSENQLNGTAFLQYRVLDDFWRGAVYNDSTWTSNDFTQADMDFAVELNPGGVGFNDRDLSEFYSLGNKILAYHGRNDETITSMLAEEYFIGVQASLNLTIEEMQSFYRLFLVPGMRHCAGGAGSWYFGQTPPLTENHLDPSNNALLALVDWVENDRIPETLIGSKYTNDNVDQPALAQRSKQNLLRNSRAL
jgi:feruloyl esterase